MELKLEYDELENVVLKSDYSKLPNYQNGLQIAQNDPQLGTNGY